MIAQAAFANDKRGSCLRSLSLGDSLRKSSSGPGGLVA